MIHLWWSLTELTFTRQAEHTINEIYLMISLWVKHTSLLIHNVKIMNSKCSINSSQHPLAALPGAYVIKLFSSLLMTRPNKLEYWYLAITFQSSLTFAGNSRSLPKREASERHSNWVGYGLALKF